MKIVFEFKMIALLIGIICFSTNAQCQTTNYRAQGNYYSAKKNFENRNFAEAIAYINKSKAALGGTNEELQYLHILSAYRLELYEQAQKEMEVFFGIGEKKVTPIYFDKSVDRLTSDETRELTMLMDPIFELADKKKNHPCTKCSGTGLVPKIVYLHCNNCGDADLGHYLVDYDDGSRKARKGYVHTEKRGYIKNVCTVCNGKGMEVCSRCNGLGSKSCKGCGSDETVWRPIGFSFFCNSCEGDGNTFSICAKCKGSKTYASVSNEKTTCSACNGRGF